MKQRTVKNTRPQFDAKAQVQEYHWSQEVWCAVPCRSVLSCRHNACKDKLGNLNVLPSSTVIYRKLRGWAWPALFELNEFGTTSITSSKEPVQHDLLGWQDLTTPGPRETPNHRATSHHVAHLLLQFADLAIHCTLSFVRITADRWTIWDHLTQILKGLHMMPSYTMMVCTQPFSNSFSRLSLTTGIGSKKCKLQGESANCEVKVLTRYIAQLHGIVLRLQRQSFIGVDIHVLQALSVLAFVTFLTTPLGVFFTDLGGLMWIIRDPCKYISYPHLVDGFLQPLDFIQNS